MRTQDYLRMLRGGWPLLVLGTLLGLALGVSGWLLQPGIHESEATLRVDVAQQDDPSAMFQLSEYTRGQLVTYAELAELPAVLDPAAQRLGLAPEELEEKISVEIPSETFLLTVSARDEDASAAADAASAVAEQLEHTIEESPSAAEDQGLLEVSQVQQAQPSPELAGASPVLWAAGGGLLGLATGVLLAGLRFASAQRPSDGS